MKLKIAWFFALCGYLSLVLLAITPSPEAIDTAPVSATQLNIYDI